MRGQLRFSGGGASPIEYIGSSNAVETSSSSGVLTPHADTAIGDLLIVCMMVDNADNTPTISGWTTILSSTGTQIKLKNQYFYHDGSASYTVTCSGGGNPLVARVFTFRNTALSSPIAGTQANSYTATTGANELFTHSATTEDNSYVMLVAGHNITLSSNAIGVNFNSSLDSYAELDDSTTTIGWDGGFGVFGGFMTTAGTPGDTTVRFNDDVIGVSHRFHIKPL